MSFYEDHVFPVFLDLATRPFQHDREQLIAQATGRVLEIGIGTGANLAYYTAHATEIVGLEPSRAMLQQAEQRARKAVAKKTDGTTQFEFIVGGAEDLPFPDNSFDTVIACLVFCTIPDVESAAREAYRVLKPNGQFLFFEHVAHPSANVRRWQERLNPVWKKVACGCHLNRDTTSTFLSAGFRIINLDAFEHPKVPALAGAMIRGKATK